jgi:hypothetical protein
MTNLPVGETDPPPSEDDRSGTFKPDCDRHFCHGWRDPHEKQRGKQEVLGTFDDSDPINAGPRGREDYAIPGYGRISQGNRHVQR